MERPPEEREQRQPQHAKLTASEMQTGSGSMTGIGNDASHLLLIFGLPASITLHQLTLHFAKCAPLQLTLLVDWVLTERLWRSPNLTHTTSVVTHAGGAGRQAAGGGRRELAGKR